jgi:Predicted metal-dependent hydrolase
MADAAQICAQRIPVPNILCGAQRRYDRALRFPIEKYASGIFLVCRKTGLYYNKAMDYINQKSGPGYTLVRKKMKNIRIRVTGEKRVLVSAPHFVPAARVAAFVQAHEAFIRQRLCDIEEKRSAHYPLRFADGDAFSYLGDRLRLKVRTAPRRAAVLSGEVLTLFLPEGAGEDEARALFARWARAQAAQIFSQRLAVLLPRFSGAAATRLCVRGMITRWGSINVKQRRVNLSVHLLRCEPPLIDYVIIHELCHIAHPRHSAAFYAALEARCPGRKGLDKRLEAYGLVGF